jgi:hypothetical protein
LAYIVNQKHFEAAPPSEAEQARMSSNEFLERVVLPEFQKRSAQQEPKTSPYGEKPFGVRWSVWLNGR